MTFLVDISGVKKLSRIEKFPKKARKKETSQSEKESSATGVANCVSGLTSKLVGMPPSFNSSLNSLRMLCQASAPRPRVRLVELWL